MAGEIDTQALITNLLPDLHVASRVDLQFWSEGDLIQWIDEATKRLSRATMLFVERDTSITTAGGTATYPLPTRHNATLHASLQSIPLRPAAMIDLEARDPGFQTVAGVPDHWYEDRLGLAMIGLTPVPVGSASLPVICSMYPPDVDTGKSNTLIQAPAAMEGYLAFSVLAKAYGRESETEVPDLAQHAASMAGLYEQVFQQYYGVGL